MLPIWNEEQRTPPLPLPTVEHGCVGVELLGCYSASGARSLLRVWIRSEKNVLENIVKKETKNQAVVKIKFGLCLLGFVIYFSRVRHHLLLPSCRLLIFVLLFLFFIFLLCFSPCSSSFSSSSLPLCPPSPSPSSTIQSLETGEDFFRRPKQIVITNTVAKPLNWRNDMFSCGLKEVIPSQRD